MDRNILSNIFCGEISGIKIKDIDSIKKIDQKRKSIRYADKEFLVDKNINIDIQAIEFLPNGRFKCRYKNIDFEMLFHYKKGMPLYVVLNGAKTSTYPEFKRWSWYSFIQGSMLNIADPMYAKYPELKIGWYYGDTETDYRILVADIVLAIAKFLDIERQDIILYGSSGGGAACVEVASRIGGSCTCIAINPQIYLENSDLYLSFVKATGLEPKKDIASKRNDPLHWLDSDCNFIFVENIASSLDCNDILCLANQLGFSVEYGLTKLKNLIVWTYDARSDQPHSAQEDFATHFQITFLKNLFESDKLFAEYKRLYLLFGEEWKKIWDLESLRKKEERALRVTAQKFEYVLEEKDILLNAKPIKYNALTLEAKILASSEYCLEIYNAKLDQESEKKYSVSLKDKERNTLIHVEQFDCSDDVCKMSFSTGGKAENLVIRIYAGCVGQTENKSLTIGRLILKRRDLLICR